MIYTLPQEVTSPKDMVKNIRVLLDEGAEGVSIAVLDWGGKQAIGMRWNIALREWDDADKIAENKPCMGQPTSRGYSTWFILPNEIAQENSKINELLKSIKFSGI